MTDQNPNSSETHYTPDELAAHLAALREALHAEHQAQLAAQLTDLQQERDAAAATATQERRARQQLLAALQHGLPPELADRLQGDDLSALAQDAARLAALLPARRSGRVGHSSQQAATRAQQIFQRIGGGDQNAFDVLLQKGAGGGAFRADTD